MISAPRTHTPDRLPRALSKALGIALPLLWGAAAEDARALEQATGVNLTASEGFGARQQGMAVQRAGFQQSADAVINAPASMNDVNDFTFATGHAEQFGLARLDNFALLVPWHAQSTLGFALTRYSVADVELRDEDNLGAPDGSFSTADWMLSGAFARRYGDFDVGAAVHMLGRRLDQSGIGMRADAMGQYTFDKRFRFGTYVRGLVPSTARWQSGYTEYEAPDASLFVSGLWPLPYFYGSLQAGLETPGLLQTGGRSATGLEGERGITDPASALATSKLGAEFNFDFGLSLRAGVNELAPSTWNSTLRLGMGYHWRNQIGIDYAFSAHPFLDQSHRVSLRFTPVFPRFEGRNFRPRDTSTPRVRAPGPEYRNSPSPYTPGKVVPGPTPPEQRQEPAPEEMEEQLEEGEMLEILE